MRIFRTRTFGTALSSNQLNQKATATPHAQQPHQKAAIKLIKTVNFDENATTIIRPTHKTQNSADIDVDEAICSRKYEYDDDAYTIVQKKIVKIKENPEKYSVLYHMMDEHENPTDNSLNCDGDFIDAIDQGASREFEGFAEVIEKFENEDFLNHFENTEIICMPDFGEEETTLNLSPMI